MATSNTQAVTPTSSSTVTSYATAYPAEYLPDARQRGRVSIAHVLPPSRDIGRRKAGIPADLVFSTILTKSLLALSLHLVKEWLLSGSKIPVGQVNLGLLLLAAAILGARQRPWELSGTEIRVRTLPADSYAANVLAKILMYNRCFM